MNTTRTITVSGEGKVTAIPDKATVRFSIVSRDEDPETARAENAEVSRNALRAVRAQGIAEQKIRLETLRLQPYRTYNDQTRRNEEAGYEATRQLVIEIGDLEKLPTIIAELVQEGANRLQGISYGLADKSEYRNQALTEAVEEARAKAELMATTLDAKLGVVMHITEQSFHMPSPVLNMAPMARGAMAKMEASPEPEAYAAGEMEVSASVQVVFALN